MLLIVGCVILVHSGYYAVAVVGDKVVKTGFWGVLPIGCLLACVVVGYLFCANVKVGVAEHGGTGGGAIYPIGVHPECAEEDFFVVAAQVAVDGDEALGF